MYVCMYVWSCNCHKTHTTYMFCLLLKLSVLFGEVFSHQGLIDFLASQLSMPAKVCSSLYH